LRAARANGLPPKFMWGIGKSRQWDEIDLLLVEALAQYEQGLCKGCGHPLSLTASEHVHPLDFKVSSLTCAGCAAMKDDPEAEKPGSGQMFFVVNNSSRRY
jgi:hypothetical protein